MSYLRSVDDFTDENFPGILNISVVKVSDVLTYPDQIDGIAIEQLVFKPGKDFVRWRATHNTAVFNSQGRDSRAGIIRNQELPFILPKTSLLDTMLTKAERDEFIVLVEDKNGFRELFGSIDKPVRFRYDRTSGSSSGRNQYSCTFYSEATGNKLIYPATFSIETDFTLAPPVIIRRGSIDGPVLAVASAGSTVVITSPYSFGYQLITA